MALNNEDGIDDIDNAEDPQQQNPQQNDEESEAEEIPFALTPGVVDDDILDFRDGGVRKLYAHATSSVMGSEGFDCTAKGLHSFLKEVKRRARQYGWDTTVCEIPTDPNNVQSTLVSLLTNHGELTLEQIVAFDETYVFNESRSAQDAHMLYHCLMNSLSQTGKDKVHLWEPDYMIKKPGSTKVLESGAALLKVILRESHLDTKATVSSIREHMSQLPHYMGTINSDIEKFNAHVMMLVEGLRARGEKSDDLLNHLFKAYDTVDDQDFARYVKRLNDRYIEEDEDFTPETLMGYASNKYKTLVLQGKWNAPSPEQEQIQALQAKLQKMEKARRVGTQRQSGKSDGKGNGKGKGGKSGNKRDRGAKKELPRWMYQRPKDSELKKPKMYDGKPWYYCSPETGGKCDCMYRRHKPADCKGTGGANPQKSGNKGDEPSPKKIKVEQALASLEIDDDDQSM